MSKRILRVTAKCTDACWIDFWNDGKLLKRYEGYVPLDIVLLRIT